MVEIYTTNNDFGYELGLFVAKFALSLALLLVCVCCLCSCNTCKRKKVVSNFSSYDTVFKITKYGDDDKDDVSQLKNIIGGGKTIVSKVEQPLPSKPTEVDKPTEVVKHTEADKHVEAVKPVDIGAGTGLHIIETAGPLLEGLKELKENNTQLVPDAVMIPVQEPVQNVVKNVSTVVPIVEKKNYIHFKFDNFTKQTSSKTSFNEEMSPFKQLHLFVNMVIESCNPKNDEILLHISSPGGYAHQFANSYSQLIRLKENGFKVTALIDQVAASGGYMLAVACDKIIASEFSQIGSIGVIAMIPNVAELASKVGVKVTTFKTADSKGGFPMAEPFTEEDVARQNAELDETFQIFKEIVSKGRTDINLNEVAIGKVWYARRALELKLIDEVCNVQDYVRNLAKTNSVYFVKQSDNDEVRFKLPFKLSFDGLLKSFVDTYGNTIYEKIVNGKIFRHEGITNNRIKYEYENNLHIV
jgi:signal peptide peptidase SppA